MADFAVWGYGLAALVYFIFGIYLYAAWRGALKGGLLLLTISVSFLWALSSAVFASTQVAWLNQLALALDVFRSASWFAFLVLLLRPLLAPAARWPLGIAAFIVGSQLIGVLVSGFELVGAELGMRFHIALSLASAVYGLVLVEQLYRGMPTESRWGLKPLCVGLSASYMFELYLFAEGFLFGRLDMDVWAVRGLAHALVVPLVALSGARNSSWSLRMSMSREAVFHSTSLAVAGLYLLAVAGAGYYVRYFGGGWGRALQAALSFAALLLLALFFFSGAQRARMRVLINKHLFPYRYDYRNEWLRFTQALSSADGKLDLGESVIKALSDLVESPGGTLWLRGLDGTVRTHSRLNQPRIDASEPSGSPFLAFLEAREWVVNLEEYRTSPAVYKGLELPEWLALFPDAWLLIPLKSAGSLVGFVVLTAPRASFEVDWEVLDLLKTAQRQAASYLERMLSAEALLEARKFESFNRMSAFVVHDLKNLVAQLSLMLKNAERHRHNPAFQEDMLETVAHVEARMRALMAQLQEKRSIDPTRSVDVAAVLESICRRRKDQLPRVDLLLPADGTCIVRAHPERLERVIGHIVQNALEATPENGKVIARLGGNDADRVVVVVQDTGCGMSDDFLRERLARPFETTKSSGMGIGVFETRQYIRELGGDVRFESEAGVGTCVTIELPRVARGHSGQEQGVVSQHD
ncbi:PEP-CTERM system histidine kinase PrsK [Azoarcus sp. L1K30]|uniref:XrtA/PEP-CTERM system histidine kinase PrsK n=1 Tax=Azoarcus sp. L1K30 TaxID=2820277 RepID=UPI001B82F4A1|nr:XrtA/PEP-CTERM system histidine kinase PrsK [Azoarcus sp. L1K30]MBR0568452.1 PEP-CTERM system histidine kinase PrsK [Azoarcus sp. L1K30]